MDRLAHDVRIALRGFRRTPAFTASVVAILALGIGMASTMAAVTDAVLRRPLPAAAPERVVTLWPTREGTEVSLMPDDLARLRHDGRTLRGVAGFVHWGAVPSALTDGDRPLVLPQGRAASCSRTGVLTYRTSPGGTGQLPVLAIASSGQPFVLE